MGARAGRKVTARRGTETVCDIVHVPYSSDVTHCAYTQGLGARASRYTLVSELGIRRDAPARENNAKTLRYVVK